MKSNHEDPVNGGAHDHVGGNDEKSDSRSGIPGTCLADFEVLSTVGKGAFGIVLKVQSRLTGKLYVLKRIRVKHLGLSQQRAVVAEVLIFRRLRHAHVVRYYNSFVENGSVYMVMEYAAHGDLNEFLTQLRMRRPRRVVREEVIWRWLWELCHALQHLHRKRIIHRDIKTMNILLDSGCHIKVGDLGVSRLLKTSEFGGTGTGESGETEQRTGLLHGGVADPSSRARALAVDAKREAARRVGTPLYMSPEVVRRQEVDYKTDVWSLGCVVYCMCTYRTPFENSNGSKLSESELVYRITHTEPAPLPSYYSSSLQRMVSRMLRKNRADRPSIEEVLASFPARGLEHCFKASWSASVPDSPKTKVTQRSASPTLFNSDLEADGKERAKSSCARENVSWDELAAATPPDRLLPAPAGSAYNLFQQKLSIALSAVKGLDRSEQSRHMEIASSSTTSRKHVVSARRHKPTSPGSPSPETDHRSGSPVVPMGKRPKSAPFRRRVAKSSALAAGTDSTAVSGDRVDTKAQKAAVPVRPASAQPATRVSQSPILGAWSSGIVVAGGAHSVQSVPAPLEPSQMFSRRPAGSSRSRPHSAGPVRKQSHGPHATPLHGQGREHGSCVAARPHSASSTRKILLRAENTAPTAPHHVVVKQFYRISGGQDGVRTDMKSRAERHQMPIDLSRVGATAFAVAAQAKANEHDAGAVHPTTSGSAGLAKGVSSGRSRGRAGRSRTALWNCASDTETASVSTSYTSHNSSGGSVYQHQTTAGSSNSSAAGADPADAATRPLSSRLAWATRPTDTTSKRNSSRRKSRIRLADLERACAIEAD